MRNIHILIGLFFILLACDTNTQRNTDKVYQEMANREIKKVSDAEIMAAGESLGIQVLDTVQKLFQEQLLEAIRLKGIEGAINYCNLNASLIAKKLEDSLDIRIKRVTNKPRNLSDTLSGLEKTIFEAYSYDPKLAATQIQELDGQTLLLTSPIKIQTGLCLNCHGYPGKGLTLANHELIKSLYPEDKAIDYQLGDLRGMWSLRVPKKTVINSL